MPGYVDTNVLVRPVVRDSPQQAHKVLQLIRDNSPVRVHIAIMLEAALVLLRTCKRVGGLARLCAGWLGVTGTTLGYAARRGDDR